MFYRMTRLHFAEDRFEEFVKSAASLRDRVEGIAGLEVRRPDQDGGR